MLNAKYKAMSTSIYACLFIYLSRLLKYNAFFVKMLEVILHVIKIGSRKGKTSFYLSTSTLNTDLHFIVALCENIKIYFYYISVYKKIHLLVFLVLLLITTS